MDKDIQIKYEVRQYFDDHFEGIIKSNLSFEDAKKLCDKLNSRPRAYVSHSMHEQAAINNPKTTQP